MPTISVVIPTYNRSHFIGDAIESAIQQSHRDTEILVVDDGSRDSTREVVAPYARCGAVRYLWQENRGVSAARNTGVRAARGELVAFLDSDDMWTPDHLRQLHDAVQACPEARVAFSNFTFVGEGFDSERRNVSFAKSVQSLLDMSFVKCGDGLWVSTDRLLRGLFEIGFTFRIQGALVHAELFRRHELHFDEVVSYTEEAQFAIEAACHTRFVFVEDVSLAVRRHDENVDDMCYGDKIVPSYENRIRRLNELFAGTLVGPDRRALRLAVGKMQTHIMRERARQAGLSAAIREGLRLLTAVPSYESVKSITKLIVETLPK